MAYLTKVNGHDLTGAVADRYGEMRAEWLSNISNRYRMAKQDRFSKAISGYEEGASADHNLDSEFDYFLMVERARELDQEDVIAGAIVDRFLDNVLQNGYTLQPRTGLKRLDKYLAARWKDWSEDPDECDTQREDEFCQLARHTLRSAIVDGDVLAIKTDTGHLQVVENHRLRTPRNLLGSDKSMTIYGVELDGSRRRVAYWVTEDDIELNRYIATNQARRIPARDEAGRRNLLHIYHPKRITQTRGVSAFAPVHSSCAMHDEIQFAKLLQQQIVSAIGLLRQRPLGFELPDDVQEYTTTRTDPGGSGQIQALKELSAGLLYTGWPGEMITPFHSNVPNPTFFDHAKQIQQLIAINLGVPLIMLLLDGSETNFSGYRGALEQAKVAYRHFQRWFAEELHSEVYAWKLRQWSTPGPLADPFLVNAASRTNIFAHEWIYPTWVSIQPLEDAKDRQERQANNQASYRRVCNEQGIDWQSEASDIIEDRAFLIELAIQKALDLNTRYPDNLQPISWIHLAGVSMSERNQLSVQLDTSQNAPDSDDD